MSKRRSNERANDCSGLSSCSAVRPRHEIFKSSGVLTTLIQSENSSIVEEDEKAVEDVPLDEDVVLKEPSSSSVSGVDPNSESSSTIAASTTNEAKTERKAPRKLIEEEKRAVGRIGAEIWRTYVHACGNWVYWMIFLMVLILAMLSPVIKNNWLRFVEISLHVTSRLLKGRSVGYGLETLWRDRIIEVLCSTSLSILW